MANNCNNCSDTGSSAYDCPALTSDITWDGGATCTGFFEGNLNDVLQHLAGEICTLQTDLAAVAVASDDVTLSTLAGSCFTVTTGGTLTAWIDEAESKICTLITDVAALDLTKPFDFNNTPVAITNQAAYTTLDTITIAANTLNTNNEYLVVEFFLTADLAVTANSYCKLSFAAVDAVIWNLESIAPAIQNYMTGIYAKVKLTRLSTNTLCVDWEATYKPASRAPIADYGVESNITPLDFTISNNILIQGLKTTGVMTYTRGRTTKFAIV